MHYVYTHHRPGPDHGVFYVGKGVGSRKSSRCGRTFHWRNVVAKHGGFRVGVVGEFASEREAFDCEIEVIALLREMGARIVNITAGGEGCSGRDKGKKLSDDHRRKLAAAKTGSVQSPETVEKRASKLRGRSLSQRHRDTYRSARRRLFGRSVLCVETGQVFECMDDAAIWLVGFDNRKTARSGICTCCQGKAKSSRGYTWKYVDRPKQGI